MKIYKWILYANVLLHFNSKFKQIWYSKNFCNSTPKMKFKTFGILVYKMIMLVSAKVLSLLSFLKLNKRYSTASVIPYLSLFHVVVYGVSVRWYMQTNFSRYYFPLRYISPSLLFCLLLLSSLTISHIPAYYEIILFLSLLVTCGWPIILKHITNLIERLRFHILINSINNAPS